MENDCRPINVNQYNHEEGKLVSSIKWLITRIYQDQGIPDKLSELFYRDEESNLKLCDAVSSVLTNGSLYSQAASKILRDPGLIVQPHGTILRALSHIAELEVRNYDGSLVTEMTLIENPIRLSAHLALIDALMTAHMKSILSIERVVQAVSEYTTVDKREEPMDCVDALLFWINKICLLVRDDVERSDIPLKNPDATIPEMEDLYEDLCDGTCICALISFYRPHEIILTDVCFNDSISLQDCRYNLGLLKNFCENYLPWNPFHFEIDDILYLHENLQPNINAFLSDLFYFFEPIPEPVYIPSMQSPTQRRFVPINQIPDLRTKNIANRPLYPPKVRPTSMIDNRNRTVSVSSQDSLMTNKSTEKQPYRPTTLPPGTISTSFGIMMDKYQSPNDYDGEKMQENKESTNLAAIRLAMHQRRQEYEQKQFLENSVTEAERQKAGKDAFFKLIKGSDSQNRTRAQSEMTTKTILPATNSLNGSDNSSGSNHQQPPPTSREEMLSAQVQSLQEQIQTMALLNRSTPGISHAISQPSIYNDGLFGGPSPMYNQQLPPDMYKTMAPYGYPPQQQPQLFEQSNYALPHQITPQIPQNSYYPPMRYGTPQHHHVPNPGMSYSMYEQSLFQQQQQPSLSPNLYGLPQQQQSFDDYGQQTIPNANNTFYLHQANASNSRLDPSLELNRNLTNWGLTYRSTTKTPRKTWADFKSEHDLRNSNENDDENVQFHSSKHEFQQRSSPPKDPEDVKPTKQQLENSLMKKSPTSPLTNGSTGFEIKNVGNNVVEDVTPEMRAKRDALYANLMKRKEQIADKVEEIEAKNMEKRQKEIEKQELAEQRRIEKEIRRQKLLDEYKRKKLEKEFPDLSTSSPNMSARSTTSLQRGHSQPPFVSMAKSQSNMTEVLTRSTPRPSRAKSNVGDENSTPRVVVPSTAEPTLKLYAKHVPKSNRSLILNALQYSIFPGAVSNEQRDKVKDALAHSDSKHFLLLFRDHKCQYRGLYTWDEQSDTAHRIHGMGPKIVKDEMMCMMYKYDSGSKHFNPIPAKHLSPTIDGFLIQEQLWMKPKIPHSGGR